MRISHFRRQKSSPSLQPLDPEFSTPACKSEPMLICLSVYLNKTLWFPGCFPPT